MPKISVVIEYDSPKDSLWLNPDNVAIALSSYCKNTKFSVEWAENGNPWIASNTKEEFFISTNTASFQLPISMDSCVEHLRAMWDDIHMTAEVRGAVEETHDFIERQLQTLL